MARGKQYSDEIKEKARMMCLVTNNIAEVARVLDIPESTIATWLSKWKSEQPDEFEEFRSEKKKDFIDKSSEIIDLAFERLEMKLRDEESEIAVNHLTTVIGTLYDKRALARGESTERTTVEIKLPEEVKMYGE